MSLLVSDAVITPAHLKLWVTIRFSNWSKFNCNITSAFLMVFLTIPKK